MLKKGDEGPIDPHILHLKTLSLILIGSFLFLALVVTLEHKDLIYPPLHRNQPSPKEAVERSDLSVKPIVIEHGSRDKKRVALTFDADMTVGMQKLLQTGVVKSWYNKEIIDYLRAHHIKATIFFTGLWVKLYPNESRDIAHDPLFEIGNHSYNHSAFSLNCYNLPIIGDDKDTDEVVSAQNIIQQTTNVTPKYFRFPGGCYEKADLENISKTGLKIVHWDVVGKDGFNDDTSSIVNSVLKNVQNGSIIVLHLQDGTYTPKTADALKLIVPKLQDRGFEFVTVSEVLN